MSGKAKPTPTESWARAYALVQARPEPKDGTLSNRELIKAMQSQQHAGDVLGYKTIAYTDFKGKPVEGEKLVEFALLHGAPLSMCDIKRTIMEAAEADDREFFIWLGKVLNKPKPPKLTPNGVNQSQLFLAKEWVHWDSNHNLLHVPKLSLCYYGGKGIAEICRLVFGLNDKGLPDNTVTASRSRLGLKLPSRGAVTSKEFFQAPEDAKLIWAHWRK